MFNLDHPNNRLTGSCRFATGNNRIIFEQFLSAFGDNTFQLSIEWWFKPSRTPQITCISSTGNSNTIFDVKCFTFLGITLNFLSIPVVYWVWESHKVKSFLPQSSEIFFSPGRVVGAAVVGLTVVVETVVWSCPAFNPFGLMFSRIQSMYDDVRV